jgi:Holliday junction resolvase RusA-like endonuclease
MIEIEIPLTPVAQSRPRFAKGMVYEDYKVKRFKIDCKWLARKSYKGHPFKRDIPLHLETVFFVGGKEVSKPDLDNLIKSLLDALEGVIYENDSQIIKLTAAKVAFIGQPKILVRAWELSKPEFRNAMEVLYAKKS